MSTTGTRDRDPGFGVQGSACSIAVPARAVCRRRAPDFEFWIPDPDPESRVPHPGSRVPGAQARHRVADDGDLLCAVQPDRRHEREVCEQAAGRSATRVHRVQRRSSPAGRVEIAPNEIADEQRQGPAHEECDRSEKGDGHPGASKIGAGREHVPTGGLPHVCGHQRRRLIKAWQKRRDHEPHDPDGDLEPRIRAQERRWRRGVAPIGPDAGDEAADAEAQHEHRNDQGCRVHGVAEHGAEQAHPCHLIDERTEAGEKEEDVNQEKGPGRMMPYPGPRVHARTRLRTAWLERQSEPDLHGAILTRRRETVVRAALLGVDGQVLLVEHVERLANEVDGDAAAERNPLLQTQVRLVLRRLDVIVPRNDGAVPVAGARCLRRRRCARRRRSWSRCGFRRRSSEVRSPGTLCRRPRWR